jgi:uncharacterized protein YeaO (DUF488 family)
VLIDRVWPRGVSGERARLDEAARDLAPSDGLRRWFGHDPARFDEFRKRFRAELADHPGRLRQLQRTAADGPLTSSTALATRDHDNAVVQAEVLREM